MKKGLLVFSGGANPVLGQKVCKFLGLDAGKIEISRFPDGEIDMKILEDVRGADVYVVQSTCPPVNENLMELLIMIDCLRRA
jgi:ribose-phosphate pyrophosphokinase